jgi:membrane dipeptidase
VDQVADHVQHVIGLVGIDHVGLGSDFEGVGDSLPVGLKNVSAYPHLLSVLRKRGLSRADLQKLCGENVLRVWQAVEQHASTTNRDRGAR